MSPVNPPKRAARPFQLVSALLAIIMMTVPPSVAQRPAGHDASLAFRFGTLGLGLEAAKLLSGSVSLRLGANVLSYNTHGSNSDVDYAVDVKLHAISALLDLHPHHRGSFHFTGGIMTNPLTVDASGVPTSSGTFKLNGHTYSTAAVGALSAEGKFSSVGPYVGLGFGTPARTGGAVKFLFDVGAVIGKPTVTLTAAGAATNPQLAADLAIQRETTQHDIRKYAKAYPVISFGLAVHL